MKEFVTAVATQLMAAIPNLLALDLYNGQDAYSAKTEKLDLPAVYLEIPIVEWHTLGKTDANGRLQAGVALLRVRVFNRVGSESWMIRTKAQGDVITGKNQSYTYAFFDLLKQVDDALEGFCGLNFTPLMRTRQTIDSNYDDLRVDVIEYTCEVREVKEYNTPAVTEELLTLDDTYVEGGSAGPNPPPTANRYSGFMQNPAADSDEEP